VTYEQAVTSAHPGDRLRRCEWDDETFVEMAADGSVFIMTDRGPCRCRFDLNETLADDWEVL
jgi:hypothetical protein